LRRRLATASTRWSAAPVAAFSCDAAPPVLRELRARVPLERDPLERLLVERLLVERPLLERLLLERPLLERPVLREPDERLDPDEPPEERRDPELPDDLEPPLLACGMSPPLREQRCHADTTFRHDHASRFGPSAFDCNKTRC
jgi:hypothetical protein